MFNNAQNVSLDQISNGTHVYDSAGDKLGSVVDMDSTAGYLIVQKGFFFPKDLYIPLSSVIQVDDDGVFVNLSKEQLQDDRYTEIPTYQVSNVVETTGSSTVSAAASTVRGTDETDIRVPVREEELIVGKQRQEEGRVHLHKEVIQEQQTVSVPLQHEQVTVERVAVTGNTATVDTADAFVERDIDVPLMGEEAVTDKRTRVVEEVRLRKDVVTENQRVTDTVRKERVIVDGNVVDDERVR